MLHFARREYEAESTNAQNDAFGKMTARDFALSVAQV